MTAAEHLTFNNQRAVEPMIAQGVCVGESTKRQHFGVSCRNRAMVELRTTTRNESVCNDGLKPWNENAPSPPSTTVLPAIVLF